MNYLQSTALNSLIELQELSVGGFVGASVGTAVGTVGTISSSVQNPQVLLQSAYASFFITSHWAFALSEPQKASNPVASSQVVPQSLQVFLHPAIMSICQHCPAAARSAHPGRESSHPPQNLQVAGHSKLATGLTTHWPWSWKLAHPTMLGLSLQAQSPHVSRQLAWMMGSVSHFPSSLALAQAPGLAPSLQVQNPQVKGHATVLKVGSAQKPRLAVRAQETSASVQTCPWATATRA